MAIDAQRAKEQGSRGKGKGGKGERGKGERGKEKGKGKGQRAKGNEVVLGQSKRAKFRAILSTIQTIQTMRKPLDKHA